MVDSSCFLLLLFTCGYTWIYCLPMFTNPRWSFSVPAFTRLVWALAFSGVALPGSVVWSQESRCSLERKCTSRKILVWACGQPSRMPKKWNRSLVFSLRLDIRESHIWQSHGFEEKMNLSFIFFLGCRWHQHHPCHSWSFGGARGGKNGMDRLPRLWCMAIFGFFRSRLAMLLG